MRKAFAVGVVLVGLVAGCSNGSDAGPSSVKPSTSVPVSAQVEVPAKQVARTAPGTAVLFGDTAWLPTGAFTPNGDLAGVTVTGIKPGEGVPDSARHGGDPYYIYLTISQLTKKKIDVLQLLIGIAGSADGKTSALTTQTSASYPGCNAQSAPVKTERGTSWAVCLVSFSNPGQELNKVIYWANTGDASTDYASNPVVWAPPAPPAPSSAVPATP